MISKAAFGTRPKSLPRLCLHLPEVNERSLGLHGATGLGFELPPWHWPETGSVSMSVYEQCGWRKVRVGPCLNWQHWHNCLGLTSWKWDLGMHWGREREEGWGALKIKEIIFHAVRKVTEVSMTPGGFSSFQMYTIWYIAQDCGDTGVDQGGVC